jgi:hypothetical protein
MKACANKGNTSFRDVDTTVHAFPILHPHIPDVPILFLITALKTVLSICRARQSFLNALLEGISANWLYPQENGA